jgi:hypothetical protein
MEALGEAALEAERPLHVAVDGADETLCGASVRDLREYPVDFADLQSWLRCPLCDDRLGHPTA